MPTVGQKEAEGLFAPIVENALVKKGGGQLFFCNLR